MKPQRSTQPYLQHVPIGERFGYLRVLGRGLLGRAGYGWMCHCEHCGRLKEMQPSNVRRSRSCGCVRKHGLAQQTNRHPLYRTWRDMRNRCRNQNNKSYKNYGGRGITICERWDDFAAFLEDMGEKPSPEHSIDRIDNDGNYSCGHCEQCEREGWPANCRWATKSEQNRNRRPRARESEQRRNQRGVA